MKFAAIDIGSNAVRLLFCNVVEGEKETKFKKSSLIRVPIRLGEDSFTSQHIISEDKIEKLVKTMQAFKNLIDVHEVVSYRACATSAMREAVNGQKVVERVKKESGIQIEIVTGNAEAEIIHANHIAEDLDDDKSYLYIDVGGGSTELTIFSKGKNVASTSFNIGTIRMLKQSVKKEDFANMREWLKKNTRDYEPLWAIGSGGNINKLINLAGKKDKPLSIERLIEIYKHLSAHTYEERIEKLGLNPDRADVIIPASEIFITVMRAADIKKIIVPQIGMSDGIAHLLYESWKKGQEKTLVF